MNGAENFWLAKVKVTTITDRGTQKKFNEQYIVSGVSATDVEVKITEEYKGFPQDWEIVNIKQMNILKVIA